jgi:hypothetical protein
MSAPPSFDMLPVLSRKKIYNLPPLILHPFSDAAGPNKLVESSRASLMLQGLLPAGESTQEELDRTLLDGRYSEIRMLYYVGKDLTRWIEQCIEHVERTDGSRPEGMKAQSFAALLIRNAPTEVQDKLKKWGVADYKAIFSRALGLNAIFAQVPARDVLSNSFLRQYFQFADQMFTCFQNQAKFVPLDSAQFRFDLFSSGEYSRMLERAWE